MVKYRKHAEIYVLMHLNQRRHMVALGIQSMFLLTPYGGASIEWVKKTFLLNFFPLQSIKNWLKLWFHVHFISKIHFFSFESLLKIEGTYCSMKAYLHRLFL